MEIMLLFAGALSSIAALTVFQKVIFLQCSTNNNLSETVLSFFLDGIERDGGLWPSRIRVDRGVENVLVCDAMVDGRVEGRGSFIAWMKLLRIYNFMDMTHKPHRHLKIVITMLLFQKSTEHLTQNSPEFCRKWIP